MTVTITCNICGKVIEGGYDAEIGYVQEYCEIHLEGLSKIDNEYNSKYSWLDHEHYQNQQQLELEKTRAVATYIASEKKKLAAQDSAKAVE